VPETAVQREDVRTQRDSPLTLGSSAREVSLETTSPKRARKWLFAAGALAVLAVVFAVYLILPFGASKFTLTVRGAPAGAVVYINEEQRGTAGADGLLTIPEVSPGSKLAVKHEGFSEFTATLDGGRAGAKSIEAKMLPLAINYGGADMVLVGAGEFEMGDDNHEADERPKHKVNLPAFYIDKYEVTNKQYKEFCDATKHKSPPNPSWDPDYSGRPDYPVLGVEFGDAVDFANWAGKRLPTEEEWEKAAGWDPATHSKREYPWGDSAAAGRANVWGQPTRVGQFPNDRSACGVFDMAGNAAEWVDAFYAPYPGANWSVPGQYKGDGVIRGTVFVQGATPSTASDPARISRRNPLPRKFPPGVSIAVGIRCAISADDPRIHDTIAARMK
jgi:formylglycine-generating enzyme required for sulfatase activity